ncbi:hypothetical protein EII34_08065 [Arachnia propionica]|uniref:Uncharacterized protein n=1 Tax=Arachnia propionica TaxID=1750 RepID=A0A3P1T683_9ACTN|nr:hypothetical protein [Arachnia propionica]MDO5083433.1 hypothetical protein [Arachnia propionica]RRD04874.1 hypothetical protein EII34_08065 [Arachnia propionica]
MIVVVLILCGIALLGVVALVVGALQLRGKVQDVTAEYRLLTSRVGELRDLTARIDRPRGRGK